MIHTTCEPPSDNLPRAPPPAPVPPRPERCCPPPPLPLTQRESSYAYFVVCVSCVRGAPPRSPPIEGPARATPCLSNHCRHPHQAAAPAAWSMPGRSRREIRGSCALLF